MFILFFGIFAYIGMTLGFIGCIATIITLAALCLKALSNATASKDSLGRYICVGVFSMYLFHSVINIGMVLAVFPVIGIPLPFFSYGGSSLWGFTILLFVFLRMDAGRIQH